MPLCSRTSKRFENPKHEGEWLDLRLLSIVDVREIRTLGESVQPLAGEKPDEAKGFAMQQAALERAIVAWSYTDESGQMIATSPENIADLDRDTAMWAFDLVFGSEAKEDSEKGSSPSS